jgi:hypothetical protein
MQKPDNWLRFGVLGLALAAAPLLCAQTVPGFTDLPNSYFFNDSAQNIGTYYAGYTFGPNVTALSVSRFGGYNSAAYPPHSGDVAIWDPYDPVITLAFATPVQSVGVWYASLGTITLRAYDQNNTVVGSSSGNPNTDGVSGSTSLLSVSASAISSVTISGVSGTFVLSSLTVNGTGAASFDLNRYGLTGSWFQVSTSGQGVELEIYPNLIAAGTGVLQGAWFTYDYKVSGGAASQRWYTFSGSVQSGQSSAMLDLYENTGGNFNAPPVTTATRVGTVVFSATDCDHTSMTYSFTDGSGRSGSISMIRLLRNVTCTSSGTETPNADFGYSGNWFDKTSSGQGIVFELNPNQPQAWLTWYTYAPNGQASGEAGQRWYTAQAAYTPGARSVQMILHETTGGLFDKPAPLPSTNAVGTATASFTSCNALKLDFTFTGGSSAGKTGTINMTRVGPTPASCGP